MKHHIEALDQEFRTAGHEVKIIATSSPLKSAQEHLPPNLIQIEGPVVPLPTSGSEARVVLSSRPSHRVKEILSRERFDVIHLHEPLMPVICPLALYHSKVHSQTLVLGTFHAYREKNAGYKYGRRIFCKWLGRLDGRIVVSEAAREYIARYFPSDYRVISNGVDLAHFGNTSLAPIPEFADGRPNILFVGRLEKRKGFVHLLQAFAGVQAQMPQVRLIVAGAFSEKQMEPFVYQVKADALHEVHFISWPSKEMLARFYRTADIVCAPSTGFESFGLVLVEAMAAGRPVVTSDIPGYREVVRHEVEGLLVPPGDEEGLAAALLCLLADKEQRERMGRNGRARADLYAWNRVAAEVLAYYDELKEQRGLRDYGLS
ncbi:MAG: glycosyltransferase family 4 protein [Anaerolineae bacterium]|nr:glycosyltransferase family 4 protein [Anaerolineae bacterium]